MSTFVFAEFIVSWRFWVHMSFYDTVSLYQTTDSVSLSIMNIAC